MSDSTHSGAAPAPGTELDFLLGPVDRLTFLRDNFRRRALHVPGSNDKFAFLGFDTGSLFAAAARFKTANSASSAFDDWPTRCRVQTPDTGDVPVEGHQVAQLAKLPGSTVCIDRVDRLDPALGRFAARLSAATALEVGINCYYSRDSAGFPLHYDDHPVFIVQLSGTKQWRFSSEPHRHAPPANFVIPRERLHEFPRQEELEEVCLRPGGVLFFPAGTLHQGKGVGHSLALTIALQSKPFGRHLIALLKRAEAGWLHEPLDPIAASQRLDHPPDDVRTEIEQRLAGFREWAAGLTATDVWTQWLNTNAARRSATDDPAPVELSAETEFEVAPLSPDALTVTSKNGQSHVRIQHAGRSVEFDCSAGSAKLLQSMLKNERFRASDLNVPFGTVRGVLRLLTDFGVLQPVSIANR